MKKGARSKTRVQTEVVHQRLMARLINRIQKI